MIVALRQDQNFSGYPKKAPFDPPQVFPELFGIVTDIDRDNTVYSIVRDILIDLELDKENLGTPEWSPFRKYVQPGKTILIKPNLVKDTKDPLLQHAVTTHPSIIRPLIDYGWKALEGKGIIIVGDAPQAESDFQLILARGEWEKMFGTLVSRGINVVLEDFRALRVQLKHGVWVGEQTVDRGSADSIIVNLGEKSFFASQDFCRRKLYGGGYGRKIVMKHHHDSHIHEYCISKCVLNADFVISVPKLKTHKKAGLTCCLKNLVGINVDKNFLPHFTIGPKNYGGDEYPFLPAHRAVIAMTVRILHNLILDNNWRRTGHIVAWLVGVIKSLFATKMIDTCGIHKAEENSAHWVYSLLTGQSVCQGAWPGNETIIRMILDLNRIFLYASKTGTLENEIQRNTLYIVDGMILGDHNGPMQPTPRKAGCLFAGQNAFSVDMAVLRAANICPESIPLYKLAQTCEWLYPKNVCYMFKVNGNTNGEHLEKNIIIDPPVMWEFKSSIQKNQVHP